jgi:hypothetical protein
MFRQLFSSSSGFTSDPQLSNWPEINLPAFLCGSSDSYFNTAFLSVLRLGVVPSCPIGAA